MDALASRSTQTCVVPEQGEDRRAGLVNGLSFPSIRPAEDCIPKWLTALRKDIGNVNVLFRIGIGVTFAFILRAFSRSFYPKRLTFIKYIYQKEKAYR